MVKMTRKEKLQYLIDAHLMYYDGFHYDDEFYDRVFNLFCGELPTSIRNSIKPDDEVTDD